jgi:hypothetical protein
MGATDTFGLGGDASGVPPMAGKSAGAVPAPASPEMDERDRPGDPCPTARPGRTSRRTVEGRAPDRLAFTLGKADRARTYVNDRRGTMTATSTPRTSTTPAPTPGERNESRPPGGGLP